MSLRTLLGDLLMKIGDSIPLPAEQPINDPFNYALNDYLQDWHRSPTTLLAHVRQAFPALPPIKGEEIIQQIAPLQRFVFELASEVNKQNISQDDAQERIRQAFPRINTRNLGKILMSNLVDTR